MQMQVAEQSAVSSKYAKAVAVSKRIRWDIERDVIRGREFDFGKKFLPDALSKVGELGFLTDAEKRFMSQVQGRSYANIFGLVERFIAAKVLERSSEHWLGDQDALEALVRFGDEEIKHQALFRRIESMCAAGMPAGYAFLPDPNAIAQAVLGKSTWAVLGLTCHIELFVLAHYRSSIDPDENLSGLWKDVFLFHWKEESQHAILDELEWAREDARLSREQRDQGVDDLIWLVGAVDGVLQIQAKSDADYFIAAAGRMFSGAEREEIHRTVLAAYRWQYIVSGIKQAGFMDVLTGFVDDAQLARIASALAPLLV
jgi:hypothetical protein